MSLKKPFDLTIAVLYHFRIHTLRRKFMNFASFKFGIRSEIKIMKFGVRFFGPSPSWIYVILCVYCGPDPPLTTVEGLPG
uniref:Uncharacterized protein n=1 Tax=Romanomermis culicivorax TaxID=13658 RepID=A0A915I287_ROMCU